MYTKYKVQRSCLARYWNMMVRGHRYWDTACFQRDTELSRSSSILRYWAFSQDTEPRPKTAVIGYWDTELRRWRKILRYWAPLAVKDTEISWARYWPFRGGILRYWGFGRNRYWDTTLFELQDTESAGTEVTKAETIYLLEEKIFRRQILSSLTTFFFF